MSARADHLQQKKTAGILGSQSVHKCKLTLSQTATAAPQPTRQPKSRLISHSTRSHHFFSPRPPRKHHLEKHPASNHCQGYWTVRSRVGGVGWVVSLKPHVPGRHKLWAVVEPRPRTYNNSLARLREERGPRQGTEKNNSLERSLCARLRTP